MYAVWGVLCGIHLVCQVTLGLKSFYTTNGFLTKSLASSSGRDEAQAKAVKDLMAKNNAFIRLLYIVTLPATSLFILPVFVPDLLRSIDYILMVFSMISGVALLSGLRFFK